MNKFLLIFSFVFLSAVTAFAQTKVTGTVRSSNTEEIIYDASVTIFETGETVKTDRIGYFQFVDVPNGEYTLSIEILGYEEYFQKFTVNNEKTLELGEITLTYNPTDENAGIITLSVEELADDESSSQPSIGLLQASRDVFARTTAFEFGSYFFRIRGYENRYQDVLFNGVRMNKIDNDRVDFGNWGGLNDITRRPDEIILGLDPSDHGFGDVGGVTAINPRPSNLRKGTSLAYSLTNRSYRQRVLATYNTGLLPSGWGFTVSGARRWAEEARVPGTLYDSWAYFVGIEKKVNENHSFVFNAFGSPYRRTTNSPNTQEVFDLRGTDYNAYWGLQNGEIRNERIRRNFEPVFQLMHFWKINDKSRLNTTLSYQFGRNGSTRLDWFNAQNPSPIFWRNTPTAALRNEQGQEVFDQLTDAWNNDPNTYQINWQQLYTANANVNQLNALRAEEDQISTPYVLADDVNKDKTYSFHTNFRTELTDDITLTAIGNFQRVESENFRELDDILGGEFILNRDDFENLDFDLNNPNRRVREGERYDYDFDLVRDRADIYVRSDIRLNKFDLSFGMMAAYTSAYRDGNYLNEFYQDNSFGKSETYDFWDFGGKGQITYKIDGRNFIVANGAYFTTAPTMNEIFPNARTYDSAVPDLESAKTTSTDLSYILRAPRLKARVTGFYTLFADGIETNFAFIERFAGENATENPDRFGALVTTGVERRHIGAEIAIDANITSTLRAFAVASIGNHVYSDNANQYIMVPGPDNFAGSNIVAPGVDDRGTAFIKDYKVAEGPQQAYSIGLEYRSPDNWWFGLSGNFLANNYVDIAHIKRTRDFVTDFANPLNPLPIRDPNTGEFLTEEQIRPFLKQERFTDEFFMNLNAGKTFRIGDYFAGISLNVNNLLDNRNFRTGGFEQARLSNFNDASDPNRSAPFGNRYWYNQGMSYFLNVFFRF